MKSGRRGSIEKDDFEFFRASVDDMTASKRAITELYLRPNSEWTGSTFARYLWQRDE
jgi:hypothetical protein